MEPEVHHGVARTGFVEQLDWLGPTSEEPLLVERRTIEVLRGQGFRRHASPMVLPLAAPPEKDKVVLRGDFYFGLGMRFLASMEDGRYFNADDKTAEMVKGKGPFVETKWVRLHRHGRRQTGDRGHLRPSGQSSPSGHDLHEAQAVPLPFRHLERVAKAGHRQGRQTAGPLLRHRGLGRRSRQANGRNALRAVVEARQVTKAPLEIAMKMLN